MTGMPPSHAADPALEAHRERLAAGRYVMSEHVVRSLMSGSITVRDIETAVRNGVVIEEHRHPGRGTAHLLAVRGRNGAIHVVCAEGAGDRLVIAFAYVPAPPVWATPGRRNPKETPTMTGKFTNCYFCGGEIKMVTVGNFDYRKEGKLYVIKRVPAGLCLDCGEKYIEPGVGHRMDAMIAGGEFTTTETVNIIEFQPPSPPAPAGEA